MSTYRELVYLILDELKGISDDFSYTQDHIMFLLDKYRGFILKQRYSDIRKVIPESNYQTICLDLIEVPSISYEVCGNSNYLRSKEKIPYLMNIGTPRVYPIDYYSGEITLISRDRMRYVGYNKYLQNIIYCSINPDNYLYFKSPNPQFLYLKKVRFTGVFQNTLDAAKLSCDNNETCNTIDKQFPLEEALIPQVVELIVKELSAAIYKPNDNHNNADDDLANMNIKQGNQ